MEFPFSRKQAERACKDFSTLIGKPLEVRADLCEPIINVVIAPFDELNKWIFLQNLNESDDLAEAMSFYQPSYFDVILLARFPDKEGYYYMDIRSYCRQQGIQFKVENYATVNDPLIRWMAGK